MRDKINQGCLNDLHAVECMRDKLFRLLLWSRQVDDALVGTIKKAYGKLL